MSVIDRFLSILAPYECLGCGAEGALLCPVCARLLPAMPERCYRCRSPSIGALTCADCAGSSPLYRVRAAAPYGGTAKELVSRLKFSGAQAASSAMAECLAPFLKTGRGTIIVPVPTAAGRIRGRGYDQARLLARRLSLRTHRAYMDCLARSGQTHQVGASRSQRLHQLHGAFRVRSTSHIRGRNLLLIDDVVTTGATLEAAARTLQAAGAARIEAAAFCAA